MKTKAKYDYAQGGTLGDVSTIMGGLAGPAAVIPVAGPFISAGLGVGSLVTGMIAKNQSANQDQENVPAVMQNTMYAQGGEINALADPSMGQLTSINSGGTHEQNPMGGVPMGQAPDGSQNLVEEGETVLNREDYVFSDRLVVDKDMAEMFSLPKSVIGKSFADASKKLEVSKNYRNDIYAVSGSDKMMDRLMYAQEAMRMSNGVDGNTNSFAYGGKMGTRDGLKFTYDQLLARQLFAESSFNPNAKSSAGATGLAQFMPGTWKEFVKETGKTNYEPTNPEHAMEAQQWYLNKIANMPWIRDHDDKQSEEVRQAKIMAAYNWGPDNVRKHLTKQKMKGVDIYNSTEWINGMPEETKNYVDKVVLGNNEKFNEQFSEAFQNFEYKDRFQDKGQGNVDLRPDTSMPADATRVAMPTPQDIHDANNEYYMKHQNKFYDGGKLGVSLPKYTSPETFLKYNQPSNYRPLTAPSIRPTGPLGGFDNIMPLVPNKGLGYSPQSPYFEDIPAKNSESVSVTTDAQKKTETGLGSTGLFSPIDIGRAVPIVGNAISAITAANKDIEDPYITQINLRSGLKPVDLSGIKQQALAEQRAYNERTRETARGNAGMMQQGFRAGNANMLGSLSGIATQAQMMNNEIAAKDAEFMARQALGNAQLAASAQDQRMRALAQQQAYVDTNVNAALTNTSEFFKEKQLADMIGSGTGYNIYGDYIKATILARQQAAEARKAERNARTT